MKKFLSFVLAFIIMVVPVMGVSAEESNKVNFYIFYGEGCGFCQKLHDFTDKLQKDKEYNKMFNIVDYEVWQNQENSNLLVKVGEYFNEDVDGVPFYVIGDKYYSGFSEESSPAEIKAAIKAAYENEKYVDIVAGIGEGTITKSNSELDEKGTKDNNIVGYIILGITAVIVVAIIFGRSNATYYPTEEQMISDVLDKIEEEPKKEVKKTTKKSTATKSTSKKSSSTTKKASTKSGAKKTTSKSKK